jgi:hypothetical protein
MAPHKPSVAGPLFGAALFTFAALPVFVRARQADVSYTVVHYWLKPGFMTPLQGYGLATLLFCLAVYCFISAIRLRRQPQPPKITPL